MTPAERPARSLSVEGDEPADHSVYQEYVRGFDEIPVLEDAVRIPPRRSPPPSFVRGERRSLRKEERADGYELREANQAELEALYGEYLAPTTATPKAAAPKRKPPRAKKKIGGSKRRRKSSAAA
jgi:hypothetical protein